MNEIERLEVRLSRLETRYRRVQLLCVASCTLLLGACLTAAIAPVSAEIRARRFVLVDEQDKERGVLETKEEASLLTLTAPDGCASLFLGAGQAEYTARAYEGFTTKFPAGTEKMESLYETSVTKGPWAGVVAQTKAEDDPPSLATLEAAGTNTRLGAAYGSRSAEVLFGSNDSLTLSLEGGNESSSILRVGESGALLSLVGGVQDFGVVNIAAGSEGVWLGGDWNDEHDFDVTVSKEKVGLSLTTRSQPDVAGEDEPPQPPPEIELTATDGAGAVRVRAGDEVIFHTP